MHIYALTRGLKERVDKYIKELECIKFAYGKKPDKNDPKKLVDGLIPMMVRPIQLWEFVFPEKHFPTILKTLDYGWNNEPKVGQFMLDRLRQLLKAKKIPWIDPNTPRLPVENNGVVCYPFGIREDAKWGKDNPLGEWAEGLEEL